MERSTLAARGRCVARYERDIAGSARGPLSLAQLAELLGPAAGSDAERKDAVACFLAGAEGWEEALRQLRGAFANEERGLTDGQAE